MSYQIKSQWPRFGYILHLLKPPRKCIACDKQIRPSKLVIAPCEHKYCPRCIRKMGMTALQDNERFPVLCCSQEIPARRVASTMHTASKRLYITRTDEHAVPPAERWYCPHTNCGRWIPPRYLKPESKAYKCPHCRQMICPRCRDMTHEERDCSEDPSLGQILEMARRHHWQRCYRCHAMVLKTEGCNHISCLCGAQFWYVLRFPESSEEVAELERSLMQNSYMCGRQFPGCSCRSATEVLNNGDQVGGAGDLDVATVVAAMEIAEREEAEIEHAEREELARPARPARPVRPARPLRPVRPTRAARPVNARPVRAVPVRAATVRSVTGRPAMVTQVAGRSFH